MVLSSFLDHQVHHWVVKFGSFDFGLSSLSLLPLDMWPTLSLF